MPEEYLEPMIYTLIDEDEQAHQFELLDQMEYNGTLYYAMTPYYDAPEDLAQDDGELIVLKGCPDEETGEEALITLDDEEEYDEIGSIFLDRIESMLYDDEDSD